MNTQEKLRHALNALGWLIVAAVCRDRRWHPGDSGGGPVYGYTAAHGITRDQTGRRSVLAPLHGHRSRTPLQLESSLWHPILSRQTKMETCAASIGVLVSASPMCFEIERTMARPIPRPSSFVVKNCSKAAPALALKSGTIVAHGDEIVPSPL